MSNVLSDENREINVIHVFLSDCDYIITVQIMRLTFTESLLSAIFFLFFMARKVVYHTIWL